MEAEDQEQQPTISNEAGAEVTSPQEQPPPSLRDRLRDLRPEKDPMGAGRQTPAAD
jgi:hypothetical protein